MDSKPVAWIVFPESRNFTRCICENPTEETFAIWDADGDIFEPLYPESALTQAREEGRREGMREAAEICGNLTFTTEISELIGMTKKQMAKRACLECQQAITRASEGKS